MCVDMCNTELYMCEYMLLLLVHIYINTATSTIYTHIHVYSKSQQDVRTQRMNTLINSIDTGLS